MRLMIDIRRIEQSPAASCPKKFKSIFFARKRTLSFVSAVLCIALLFTALPARADIITFYPSSCLGGWVNPEHAQGQFSVLDREDSTLFGDAATFSRENSAVLEGSAAQIFCGGFKADVPEDANVSGFTLIFSWDFRDPGTGSSIGSPLSVDTSEYDIKQAAAVATAFYRGGAVGSSTAPVGRAEVLAGTNQATTTIVASDATSTANAILNLDTRQAAEIHIEFPTASTTAVESGATTTSQSQVVTEPVVPTEPAAPAEERQKAAVIEAVPEAVTPPPAAAEPVPAQVEAAPAVPVPSSEPQSFNVQSLPIVGALLKWFITPVHAQEAPEAPAAAVEPAPTTEQTPTAEAVTPPPAADPVPAEQVPPPAVEQKASVIEALPAAPADVTTTTVATTTTEAQEVIPVSTSTSTPAATTTVPVSATDPLVINDAPFMEVLYSIDGTTWRQIGTVSAQNWKYSRFALPITDWHDLEKLQITLQTMPVVGTMPTVYLDGLAVEANVLYSRRDPNPTPDLLADTVIKQEVAASYRAALIRRVEDVGRIEFWISEVVDPQSLRVLSGKNPLEAQLIQRALTSTTTSRLVRLAWRKVADSSLIGEHSQIATYQRSVFWTDQHEQSVWRYSLDSNSYESVSIDPVSGYADLEFADEAGQTVWARYTVSTKKFEFTHLSDQQAGEGNE